MACPKVLGRLAQTWHFSELSPWKTRPKNPTFMGNYWGPLFQCHVSCQEIAGLIKGDGLHHPCSLYIAGYFFSEDHPRTWIRGYSPWLVSCCTLRIGLWDPFQNMEVILATNWDDPPSWSNVLGWALRSQPIHYESLKGLYVHIQVGQMHLEIWDDGWTTNGRENECYTRRNQHHESYYNA